MITKFSDIWASGGDTGTAPSSAKQQTGFVRRDKPVRQLMNWLFNGVHNSLNGIIGHVSPEYDAMTVSNQFALSSGLHLESWANANEVPNKIDCTTGTIDRLQVCFIDGVTYVMALDTTNNVIKLYNSITGDLYDTSPNLASTITGASVVARDFCCDNSSVYVLFETSTTHRIGKFAIGGAWAYDGYWTPGGTALSGTGTFGEARIKYVRYSTLTGFQIAVSCPWTTVTSSSSAAIQMFWASNGSSVGVGAGDCPTTLSLKPTGSMASDGTYIYFSVSDGASAHRSCSLTMSTRTTGCGGTGWPGTTLYPFFVSSIGKAIVSVINDTAPSTSRSVSFYSNSSEYGIDQILMGTPASGGDPNETYLGGCSDIVTDGQNTWFGTVIKIQSAGPIVYRNAVIGFDAALFSPSVKQAQSASVLTEISKGPYMLPSVPDTGKNGPSSIVFDGRDLWTCAGTQYLYRVPRISIR